MSLPPTASLAAAHTQGAASLETALRADVAERLRRVCADMPPTDFAALVEDICAMKLRWQQERVGAARRHE
jgi:hypothetical protein